MAGIPIESAVTVTSAPWFARASRACRAHSRAVASKGLITACLPSRTMVLVLGSIFTSVLLGTALTQAMMRMLLSLLTGSVCCFGRKQVAAAQLRLGVELGFKGGHLGNVFLAVHDCEEIALGSCPHRAPPRRLLPFR